MSEAVGFIGVGAMGSAIASRLVDNYELHVNDRNPAVADKLVERGATFSSLTDIASRCSYVFLSLPRPTDVADLLQGQDGLAQQLKPGSVIIDTTTGTPTSDQALLALLNPLGVDYVDAPIGGGVRRAEAGNAALMIGASDDVYARVEPLLRAVTEDVIHVGPVGSGHAAKLVNNLLNSCNRFAAMEAIRLGEVAGISREMIVDVINRGSARNYATENTYPQLLMGGTAEQPYKLQNFTLQLLEKDLRLANQLAEELGHDTPIGHLVQEFVAQAVERFGPDADQSQMMAEWYPETP
ncbi:2-hydroxy-3-oxopropionate reductase [Marmoricola sp. Leaf446]|uniref:NAD(P)-dependent oxidoreductase n=1 Tax=Marmoricola sp. Leaf446 TaxID=1736379 RepID=UPI0006F85131|nr:NAD(P)-dependent oxidoreductase [Marmoricola sp. Leaf446]KQT93490.1 2-hydroxy-3-oxopropionate reductase [Marmoricola sp. Leaf446]